MLKGFNILPRYNTICYAYIVAIYFIFVLGNVTVAMTRREEAIEEVPSENTCPVFEGTRPVLWQEIATSLNVHI